MKRNGLSEDTITSRTRNLKQLAKMADLDDTEQTKERITSNTRWSKLTQRKYTETYTAYLRFIGKTWQKPTIKPETRLPFIPLESEIDQLIATCGKTTATLLQTLKETGIRISELVKLKWLNLTPQSKTLNITPSKNSNPRILPISDKLINMLNQLPKNRETIFSQNIDGHRDHFSTQRRTAANKLQNPRLLAITFHPLRHWKATMEYHKTKDILHVKYVLGHKNIANTMIYINIEQALFTEQNDEYTCKAAKTPDECMKLAESGFTKFDEIDGIHLYRKRK